MPLEPPCTSSVSPAAEPAALEHVRPDREQRLRQRRRRARVEAARAPAGTAAPARRSIRRSRRRPRARRPRRLPSTRRRPGPQAATAPATSSPGMSDAPGGGAYLPWRCRMSGRLTPAAATAISTSRGPGSGVGRVTGRSTSGPPGCAISIARHRLRDRAHHSTSVRGAAHPLDQRAQAPLHLGRGRAVAVAVAGEHPLEGMLRRAAPATPPALPTNTSRRRGTRRGPDGGGSSRASRR